MTDINCNSRIIRYNCYGDSWIGPDGAIVFENIDVKYVNFFIPEQKSVGQDKLLSIFDGNHTFCLTLKRGTMHTYTFSSENGSRTSLRIISEYPEPKLNNDVRSLGVVIITSADAYDIPNIHVAQLTRDNMPSHPDAAIVSPIFDEEFYLSQLPTGAPVPDPLMHYLMLGWRLGYKPHVGAPSLTPSGDYVAVGRDGNPYVRQLLLQQAAQLRDKPAVGEGYVETVTKSGAKGWVWTPIDSPERFRVEARLGDRVIATAVADEPRQDTHEKGREARQYGFALKFASPLCEGETPAFMALRVDGETKRLAANSLVDVEPSSPVDQKWEETCKESVANAPISEIEGSVDVITEWMASGWVWAPKFPDRALEVEAVLDGEVIGKTAANQMRQDLVEHNKGTGKYGFILTFARPLESATPPVFRVGAPTGTEIIHGIPEVRFNPQEDEKNTEPPLIPGRGAFPLPDIEGSIDYLTRRRALGWAWFPSHPDVTAQVEAVVDGEVIGQATADQPRADLAQHGKGTGFYGFEIKFDATITGKSVPEFRVRPIIGHSLNNQHVLPPASPSDYVKRPADAAADLIKHHAAFTSAGPLFEEFDPTILECIANRDRDQVRPMLIAFYLPQFHAIEENDKFWGKGFTEWRQLPKAIPRFPGHYQPRIPRDLGFYNLENLDNLRRQVEMATAAGVYGFSYYYYWFNRKRVLERPLEMLLDSDVNMPFMLIWANENWTRTWDGSESQILLKQDYKEEDDDALIDDLSRHFLDRRYIRLNGRPLIVIYNPKSVPDNIKTFARWRKGIEARIGVEPLIFMAQTFGETDPRAHGLDGALEFPPHKLSNHLPGRPTPDAYSPEFSGRVIAYDDFVKASLDEDEPTEYPLIKTAVPSWDNDCRRPNRGVTLEAISPAKYQGWLAELLNRAMDAPIEGAPIVAINAWNEWAESAYLEPDVHYGAAFLNATARAYVSAVRSRANRNSESLAEFGARPGLSVIFPNYNHARFLPERLRSVLEQTVPPDEIVFLDDCSSDNSVEVAKEILASSPIPYRIVVNETNSGGVFRQWLKGLSLAKYDLIWVAETDDSADRRFLSNLLPAFAREDVMAAFGRISCIDPDGAPRNDLDSYFDALENFTWNFSCVVPAFKAFSRDFAIRNVIPNASGLVFRKPSLTPEEKERLLQFRFAGDWYFYALVARGGAIAYSRRARSYFRVNPESASRSSFFTDRHLTEHMMIVEDLRSLYAIDAAAVEAHSDLLSPYLPDRDPDALREDFLARAKRTAPPVMRVCVAAHSFAIGGGEILPVDLANALKARGLHVTYLVVERPKDARGGAVRQRLRADIPVVYWDDVCDDFSGFLEAYGVQLINSHNVSVDYRIFMRNLDVKIPYVASLHGGFETVQDLMTKEFLAFLDRTVSRWMYLSEKNLAFLPESLRDPEKLTYSFNAVAPYEGEWIDRKTFRAERGIPEDAFVFVQCSRAIESKGWRISIEVVEALASRVARPVHLVLIGDGPAAPALKAEYESSPFVTFLGQIDRPIRYFRCFDMGIFPSTFEGETFPLFLLECFQTGLPVAATDIGEIPRIMVGEGGRTPGILLDHCSEAKARVAECMAKLEEMFNSEGVYEALRACVLATSKQFSIDALADLYWNCIAETRIKRTLADELA